MDAMEAILSRRSIRKYTDQPVDAEVVQKVLRAAMSAPSAGNEQSWQFVVINDRNLLTAIPKFHPYAGMLEQASVAILVCGDVRRERHAGYWVQDCSAAMQNLLLAAHSLGLGAVWLGIYPDAARVAGMRSLLNLPEPVIPLGLAPLGYPAESRAAADRYTESLIHYNGW